MGYIFYLMGKSSSGKDTIYKELINIQGLPLKTVVGYTTRPMRSGEKNGCEYFFVDNSQYEDMETKGIVIESRDYHTVYGIWSYFTADDGQINIEKENYVMIGTLESYEKVRNYYGEQRVIPLYIEVEDGERLSRALERERGQKEPRYGELCRRFLADSEDFNEEELSRCSISHRYSNVKLSDCINEICGTIKKVTGKKF